MKTASLWLAFCLAPLTCASVRAVPPPPAPRGEVRPLDLLAGEGGEEAARRPGVAGVHFDYIRYPNGKTCFCDGCRQRFEKRLGEPRADWPTAALPGGRLREDWLQFRCDNITQVVRETSRRVREVKPECRISAAVFKNYPNCVTDVAQDWRLWAERGYLDFLCPMNYTASNAQFRECTRGQLAYLAGSVPCYPGIGLLEGQGVVGALQQIEISRELRTGGFVVWSVYANYMNEVFPYLALDGKMP